MRFVKVTFDYFFEDDFDLQSLFDELEVMGLNPSYEEFDVEEDEEPVYDDEEEEVEEDVDPTLN